MKIGLVYRKRPRWPKFRWVHNALSGLGHECIQVETIEQLQEADKTCDLVLFEQRDPGIGWKAVRDFARSGSSLWVQWWFDLLWDQPHEPLMDRYGPMLRRFDLVCVKERRRVPEYLEQGIRAVYLDQGCPADLPVMPQQVPEFDVITFGSMMPVYQQRREDVLALVKAGFRVAWAGDNGACPEGVTPLPWTHPEQLPSLLARAAVCLCVDLRDDVPGYWSDRLWLALGAGAAIVRRGSALEPSVPCLTYLDSPVEPVAALLKSPEARRQLQIVARATALANTYHHRCRELLAHADLLRKQGCRTVEGALPEMR